MSTIGKRTKWIAGAAVALAVVGVGAGVAAGADGGGDDDEAPITGEALDRASTAALEHTGEGEVTETEAGDEESRYEVEVTLEDGREVDVQLDERFRVVDSRADEEEQGRDDD